MKGKEEKFTYQCIHCDFEVNDQSGVQYLCPECSKDNAPDEPPAGALRVVYDYHAFRYKIKGFKELKQSRYLDLFPVKSMESFPTLRIGDTPLYSYASKKNTDFPFNLFIKDDGQNPTFSYKDRASALVSAYARENGLNTIVAASTGNAGSSMAGICAAQRQKAVIMVPESAPVAKISQVLMYGATLVPVKGTYDDAFELSLKATEAFGWYNRNTGFNPLTIEGKKSAAFEIYEQMNGTIPDRIFVPVGDGVIISGVYKGFEDLLQLEIIDRMPVIVAVQSAQSANLVNNLNTTEFKANPSTTIADSISVDIPRNFYMAKGFINKYGGIGVIVDDSEIMEASAQLACNYGIFAEPAASAAYAGLCALHQSGKINEGSNNVVMLTGSGLKDLKSIQRLLRIPEPIDCSLESLNRYMSDNPSSL